MMDIRHRDYTHFFCICCGEPTSDIDMDNPRHLDKEYALENGMYDNALVDTVSAGYGSNHDGDVFYVSICDKCVTEAAKDGRLAYKYNYMSVGNPSPEEYDTGYSKRMRDVKIGNILE